MATAKCKRDLFATVSRADLSFAAKPSKVIEAKS
jgi:hypothetical protein